MDCQTQYLVYKLWLWLNFAWFIRNIQNYRQSVNYGPNTKRREGDKGGGKGRRPYHCVEMILWLWLRGNYPIIVWKWSNHCVEMIQWLCGIDTIIVWKWSNGYGCVEIIQSLYGNDPMVMVAWKLSNYCMEMIQWLWFRGNYPIIVWKWSKVVWKWCNHCVEMIQWFCRHFRVARGNNLLAIEMQKKCKK